MYLLPLVITNSNLKKKYIRKKDYINSKLKKYVR